MKMVRSEREGSVGYRLLEDGVSPQRCFSILVTFGQSLSLSAKHTPQGCRCEENRKREDCWVGSAP